LNPSDTSVEFEFSSLDFHDVMRNQFMYRLKGFDHDWIMQIGKRGAYYSNLPVGKYQLEVRGSNNHGLFNTIPLTLNIEVLPHWWQYRSVQFLAFVLILMVILGVHLYRMRHFSQINRLLQHSVQERAKAQLILETKVTERTRALEESSMTLSLRTKQLEKSLTEVAKANRELKRLDKLKDEFISTVSHELRTPLTSIRGAVGLIAQHVVEPGSASYDLLVNTAVSNCERLSQLINDLLDVQKFEAGKFELHRRPIDLVALCQDAIQGMESYAVRYQVKLAFQSEIAIAQVEADPLRIRQVIDNLLSNAVKFSHAEGVVTLKLTFAHEDVLLEVIDEGEGIPEQFQGRIFEKFSQADASDSRAKEGTGLGLTICRKIVESHEGSIGFSSTEHVGTTFWVRLKRITTSITAKS
jgi:signal transduction histidine kinase